MTEEKKNNDNNDNEEQLDLSSLADLSFGPDWARKPSDEIGFSKSGGDKRESRRKKERKKSEPRRFKPGRLAPDRSPDRNIGQERRSAGEHKRPYIEMPPIYVRFLPEQEKLSAISRKIRATKQVYPLNDLAKLVFSSPGSCYVKMEVEKDPVTIFQCRECRTVGLDYDKMLNHVAEHHLDLFFDIEEIETEPPSGTFPCIAKCTIGGEIIAPPNHHSYSQSVKDLYESKYSNMPYEQFKQKIVTIKDEEAVEQWKEAVKHQIVYRLKKNADGVPDSMNKSDAVKYSLREFAPKLIVKTKSASLPMKTAEEIEDAALQLVFRAGYRRENRFPRSLLLALRTAFKHMQLHVFRFGGNNYYITSVKPVPLDTEFIVEELAEVLNFIKENPGCSRKDLIAGLRPGEPMDSDAAEKVFFQLHCLIDRGHVLEFFGGKLFAAGQKPPAESLQKNSPEENQTEEKTADKENA